MPSVTEASAPVQQKSTTRSRSIRSQGNTAQKVKPESKTSASTVNKHHAVPDAKRVISAVIDKQKQDSEALRKTPEKYGHADLVEGVKHILQAGEARAAQIRKEKNISDEAVAKYGNRSVIGWSEIHSMGTDSSPDLQLGRETLRKLFPRLKELGVKTIALEVSASLTRDLEAGKKIDVKEINEAAEKDGSVKKSVDKFIREIKSSGLERLIGFEASADLMADGFKSSTKFQGTEIDISSDNFEEEMQKLDTSQGLTGEWNRYAELAREHGIRVIAIDAEYAEHSYGTLWDSLAGGTFTQFKTSIDEAYKLLSAEPVNQKKLGELKKQIINLFEANIICQKKSSEGFRRRDKIMADNLAKALEDPENGNILFTGGLLHTAKGIDSAFELLSNMGINAITLEALFPESYERIEEKVSGNAEPETSLDQKLDKIFEGDSKNQNKLKSINLRSSKHTEVNETRAVTQHLMPASAELYESLNGKGLKNTMIFPCYDTNRNQTIIGKEPVKSLAGVSFSDFYDGIVIIPAAKKGIFKRIWNWFGSLFSKIIGIFSSKKSKTTESK